MSYIENLGGVAGQVNAIERSARVLRYHTEPVLHKQSVGEHTYGVMWFVVLLSGGAPSAELLMAALAHDTPEFHTGDMPAPTKRAMPGLREALTHMEQAAMMAAGLHDHGDALTAAETRILKLADALEGLQYCAFELRRGNKDMRHCFDNFKRYAIQFQPLSETEWDIYYALINSAEKEH